MLQALEQVLPGSPQTGHGDTEIHAEAFVKDTHWSSSQRTAGAGEGPAESQLVTITPIPQPRTICGVRMLGDSGVKLKLGKGKL